MAKKQKEVKDDTAATIIGRDTSWLYFNHRVLQEAMDPSVPLYERLKFLAIYSNNLDEFFRVRVSSLRSFRKLSKKDRKQYLDFKPKQELKSIRTIVEEQQALLGRVFQQDLLPQLEASGVFIVQPQELTDEQQDFVARYFRDEVKAKLEVYRLDKGEEPPHLENRQLYFVAPESAEHVFIVKIPAGELPRFVVLPATEGQRLAVSYLDDIVRLHLSDYLAHPIEGAYSIKLSRDADLYIDNEYEGDLLEKIRQALDARHQGLPTRFLYDSRMPDEVLKLLKKTFDLSKFDLIPGGRYHNFNDFFHFPFPPADQHLHNEPLEPHSHPAFASAKSLLRVIEGSDQLLHFPYQRYEYVPALIREAAAHADITDIKITLYRVADKSAVVTELLAAQRAGKQVSVFIEAKARFDEASNLYWGDELERAGARVQYSFPGIKVHTKLLQISGERQGETFYYTYVGTGNFNEKTARLYTDHALLTADPRIGRDVAQVFQLLEGRLIVPQCKHLLVAPFTLRDRLLELMDREIERAQSGEPASIFAKMNSLEEMGVIEKLQEAAAAGVEVRLIVRGICRLAPHPDDPLQIISIVDRFLEHGRIWIFGQHMHEEIYLASADWMERNLFRRVEVAVPIYNPRLRDELKAFMELQWKDNTKARRVDNTFQNTYVQRETDHPYRSQVDLYHHLQQHPQFTNI